MSKKENNNDSSASGYERSDIHFGKVLLTGIGLLVLMGLGMLHSAFTEGMFTGSTAQPGAPPEVLIDSGEKPLPPEPRVQPDPHVALIALRAHEDSILTTYRWVSRDSGIVQIPVERSMELVVEKGLVRSR